MRSLLVFFCILGPVLSCKTRPEANKLKETDIREKGQNVRVIYKEKDKNPASTKEWVYLIVCPKENVDGRNVTVDHLTDEEALGKDKCNDAPGKFDASVPNAVQKMEYTKDYLPRLKKSVGFSPDQPATSEEIKDLQEALAKQQEDLAVLDGVGSQEDSDPASIARQKEAASIEIGRLQKILGPPGADAATKIKVLDALTAYLDISKKYRLNIAQRKATHLVNPFKEWQAESVSAQQSADAQAKTACFETMKSKSVVNVPNTYPDLQSGFLYQGIGTGCWFDAVGKPRVDSNCGGSEVTQSCAERLGPRWYLISQAVLTAAINNRVINALDNGAFYWTSDPQSRPKGDIGTIVCYALPKYVDPEGNLDGDEYLNKDDHCSKLPPDCTLTFNGPKDYGGFYTGCTQGQNPDEDSAARNKFMEEYRKKNSQP